MVILSLISGKKNFTLGRLNVASPLATHNYAGRQRRAADAAA
jgi:hypothetical protein